MAELNRITPDIQLPMNTVEQRDSAHFQEINYRYHLGMSELWMDKYDDIVDERESTSREHRIMKYAQPSYTYRHRKLA